MHSDNCAATPNQTSLCASKCTSSGSSSSCGANSQHMCRVYIAFSLPCSLPPPPSFNLVAEFPHPKFNSFLLVAQGAPTYVPVESHLEKKIKIRKLGVLLQLFFISLFLGQGFLLSSFY